MVVRLVPKPCCNCVHFKATAALTAEAIVVGLLTKLQLIKHSLQYGRR